MKMSMIRAAVVPSCIVLLLSVSSLYAQQQSGNQQQESQASNQGSQQSQSEKDQGDAGLPSALSKLDLKEGQKRKIEKEIANHNEKLRETWQKFSQHHAKAIELEAAWAAAVRDTLSASDKKKFDQKRMEDRQAKNQQSSSSERHGDYDEDESESTDKSARNESPRQQKRQRSEDRRASDSDLTAQNRDRSQEDQTDAQARRRPNRGMKSGRSQYRLFIVTSGSPESYIGDAQQTPAQKRKCDQVCRQFKKELNSVWQELAKLHGELVQIESQKIRAVEDILTEEQLTQMRSDRSNPRS